MQLDPGGRGSNPLSSSGESCANRMLPKIAPKWALFACGRIMQAEPRSRSRPRSRGVWINNNPFHRDKLDQVGLGFFSDKTNLKAVGQPARGRSGSHQTLRWRRQVSSEPVSEAKFPASWENTGNFVRLGLRVRLLARNQ